jgi:hypothetical protein
MRRGKVHIYGIKKEKNYPLKEEGQNMIFLFGK